MRRKQTGAGGGATDIGQGGRGVHGDRMEMNIVLVPVGGIDGDVLHFLAKRLDDRLNNACRIADRIEPPRTAFHEARGQYDARAILAGLAEHSPTADRIIGVTREDMFVPVLKYVYGLARIEGRTAVISLHRLYPAFEGAPPDAGLLLCRAEKTLLHELGHTHGLTHCRKKTCVMYSSTRIADTDAKQRDFCPTCGELFRFLSSRLHESL